MPKRNETKPKLQYIVVLVQKKIFVVVFIFSKIAVLRLFLFKKNIITTRERKKKEKRRRLGAFFVKFQETQQQKFIMLNLQIVVVLELNK